MFHWLYGWVRFEVNGRRFYLYDRAMKEAAQLSTGRLDVSIHGYRIGVGWRLIVTTFVVAGRHPDESCNKYPKL